jgi:hypothetical protein
MTSWYDSWDDSNNPVRGILSIDSSSSESSESLKLSVTGNVVVASGYYKIPVAYLGGSILTGGVVISFSRSGDNAVGNRNVILNSAFDIWQRGTSFTGTPNYYAADRWQNYRAGAAAGSTYTRQSAGLDGFDYAVRLQRNSGNTDTTYVRLGTSFETSQVKSLWGQPLTFSFYARAGANLSSISNQVGIQIVGGTGTDGSLGGGFTGTVILLNSTQSITTSWVRYTVTLSSLINTYTQLGVVIQFTPTGTAGAADFIEITGVQLEAGSVATPFARAATTLQGELAACQRYYYRQTSPTAGYNVFAIGSAASTTSILYTMKMPTTMRVTPTAVDFSTLAATDGPGLIAISSLSIANGTPDTVLLNAGLTGATQFRPYTLNANNSASSFVGLSAEL